MQCIHTHMQERKEGACLSTAIHFCGMTVEGLHVPTIISPAINTVNVTVQHF